MADSPEEKKKMEPNKKKAIWQAAMSAIVVVLVLFAAAALLKSLTPEAEESREVEEKKEILKEAEFSVEVIEKEVGTLEEGFIEYPVLSGDVEEVVDRVNARIEEFIQIQIDDFIEDAETLASGSTSASPSQIEIFVDEHNLTKELLKVTFSVERYFAGASETEFLPKTLTIKF